MNDASVIDGPVAFALFCDDIRYELGNKVTLVGLYNADLLASDLPLFLPRLGVVLHFRHPIAFKLSSLAFKVTSNGDLVFQSEMPSNVLAEQGDLPRQRPDGQEPSSHRTLTTHVIVPPMTVTSTCTLRASFIANGVEFLAGKLHISKAQSLDAQAEAA